MGTKLYYQISTGRWLGRIDHNIPDAENVARDLLVAYPGIAEADLGVVETEALDGDARAALVTAAGWVGTPPHLPTPGSNATTNRIEATAPDRSDLQSKEEIILEAIDSATSVDDVKQLLRDYIGNG
jgi:hypothetical protein